MAYTIVEQETHIWYDPQNQETIVETNYVHDINHYLYHRRRNGTLTGHEAG